MVRAKADGLSLWPDPRRRADRQPRTDRHDDRCGGDELRALLSGLPAGDMGRAHACRGDADRQARLSALGFELSASVQEEQCPAAFLDVHRGFRGGAQGRIDFCGYARICPRGAGAVVSSISFRGELDKLNALAQEKGLTKDPHIRQRLAQAHIKVEIMRFLGYRTLTAFMSGNQPGPEASIGKLWWSEYHKEVTELAIDILGANALVPVGQTPHTAFTTDSPGSPNDSANWVGVFLNARAGTIYAGTSQVQRGIVGEQVLGLPKEPRADGGPWKNIPGHG